MMSSAVGGFWAELAEIGAIERAIAERMVMGRGVKRMPGSRLGSGGLWWQIMRQRTNACNVDS